ncbi:MAG: FG-GAP-like repeat-containing protein [Brumimicrobium sp.]
MNKPFLNIDITFMVGIFVVMFIPYSLTQTFTNIASAENITTGLNTIDKYGSSVSFYDFDNDGWDDLTFATENDSILFYKNNGGTYNKIGSFIYGSGKVKHVLWVDYDNDGFLDLFLTEYEGSAKLFHNDGNFNFTDVSQAVGLPLSNTKVYGASFADFNKDGFLDLYLCNYEYGYNETETERLNQLYKNNGDGTFSNITQSAGVGDSIRTSFQGLWFDYNNDGWEDLYVINDRYPFDNTLYRNNGDETFSDVTTSAGLGMDSQNPMTLTLGDFNNNGFFDIYITNTGFGYTTKLFVNNGDGTFTEEAVNYGVSLDEYSWGALWIDYDNNSWEDLYVATGTSSTFFSQIESYFYENSSGTSFTENNALFNSSMVAASYSVAKGDIDNDGYYDIVSHNDQLYEPFLWQNSGGQNNYIKVTPQGTVSNNFAIGTLIKIYVQGQVFSKYTLCGENYIGQNSQHIIFGLGDFSNIDSMTVRYNTGHIDKYYSPAINTHHYLMEGETLSADINQSGGAMPCENQPVNLSLNTNIGDSVLWSNGLTGSNITINNAGTYYAQITTSNGITYYSDTVNVQYTSLPTITSTVQDISCFGSNDGMIELDFGSNMPDTSFYDLTWSTGDTSSTISSLSSGNYSYYYLDSNGCGDTVDFFIDEPYPIDLQYLISHEVEGGDGSIQILLNGGTAPYTTYLNGVEEQPPFENLSSGIYELIVEDDNGCTITQEFVIEEPLSISEDELNKITLYPNPVKEDYFFISISQPLVEVKISIMNELGQVVGNYFYENLASGEHTIPFQKQSKGVYIVDVKSSNLNRRFKLIR